MKNKKQSIIIGGLLGSAGIFVSKIIGILYVIPFTALIGESNLVYYSSAFRIYEYLLNISLAGFPFAIATLVAKYAAKGDYKTTLFIRKLSTSIMATIGFVSMIVLILCSGWLSGVMMPSNASKESLEITKIVLILIAFALFFVPLLSSIRGFYQGLKNMEIYAVSQVLEQLSRVIFLLGVGAIAVYIFNQDQIYAVYFAVISTSFSAVLAYIHIRIYDKRKMKEYRLLIKEQTVKANENKEALFKEIIRISVPYLLLALFGYSYVLIDTTLFSKSVEYFYNNSDTFINYSKILSSNFSSLSTNMSSILAPSASVNYDVALASANYTNSLFGISFLKVAKLTAIPMILAPGFSLAIIPYITTALAEKSYKKVRKNILDCIESVLYIGLPLVFCLFFLAKPIYYFMYGGANVELGSQILRWFCVDAFFSTIVPIFASLMMALELRKFNIINTILAVVLKCILIVPLVQHFSYMGIILSSVPTYILLMGVDLKVFSMKFKLKYKKTLLKIAIMMLGILAMYISFVLLSYMGLCSINTSRIMCFINLGILGLVGCGVYFMITYILQLPQMILGINLSNIKAKFLKGKRNEA